jgi:hypothetical protein
MKNFDNQETDENPDLHNQNNANEDGYVIDESDPNHHGKVRRRIKVRKKIRVRQKPSVKKKLLKLAEKLFWVIIVVGFITALIVMVVELDIQDENLKNKKKANPVKIFVHSKSNFTCFNLSNVLYIDDYISKFARLTALNDKSV